MSLSTKLYDQHLFLCAVLFKANIIEKMYTLNKYHMSCVYSPQFTNVYSIAKILHTVHNDRGVLATRVSTLCSQADRPYEKLPVECDKIAENCHFWQQQKLKCQVFGIFFFTFKWQFFVGSVSL